MFPNIVMMGAGEEFVESSTKVHPLGTIGVSPQGRVFRYVKMGATAAVVPSLYQCEVPSNAQSLAIAVAAAQGDFQFTATLGATARAADYFEDGWAIFELQDDGSSDSGFTYAIRGNAAGASGGSCVIYLDWNMPLQEPLTTSSTVSLFNPYEAVIVHPSPPTAALAGVACKALTAEYYGWLLIQGINAGLIDGTVTLGSAVRPSEDDDGAVALFDADEADDANHGPIGWPLDIGSDGTIGTIHWHLPM